MARPSSHDAADVTRPPLHWWAFGVDVSEQQVRRRPQPADRENGGAIGLECSCSVIHLSASYSAIKPLMASVSPSGQRISTSQPVPGFFRATKVGRCSDILRICACGGPVQASYPAAIKLTHYPGSVLCPLGQAFGQSEARDRSTAPARPIGVDNGRPADCLRAWAAGCPALWGVSSR